MELGLYGLGRMGANMVVRLTRGGHRVVASNRSPGPVQEVAAQGAVPAANLAELVSKLEARPRALWLMVPSGQVTDDVLHQALELLAPGDIIIDGGNSNFHDTIRRAGEVEAKGMHYLDCGTSGGVWGLREGYSLMVGGEKPIYDHLEPLLATLAPPEGGHGYMGGHGAGHFVKMVHNGIEYGMLQAFGEGFEILEKSQFNLDLHEIAQVWRYGSVVRSWLLDLAELALRDDAHLTDIKGYVEDSGEGRWTVQAAIDENVPAPIITLSLLARFASRQPESFSAKVIAALRNQFGGHAIQLEPGGKQGEIAPPANPLDAAR
ncbi:MAG TPA: decarboxylating 6-phosphogluconate dehydrogenase [Ktedonobacterales bacterium]|jgi:6-phosphogluconate dehydrogenase|nr:decarboxylating 6-phosphogluconate dehydrogenase [Ktedonobacterales bacterium]